MFLNIEYVFQIWTSLRFQIATQQIFHAFFMRWPNKAQFVEARMGVKTLLYTFNLYHCWQEAEADVNLLTYCISFESHYFIFRHGKSHKEWKSTKWGNLNLPEFVNYIQTDNFLLSIQEKTKVSVPIFFGFAVRT